MSTTNRDHAVVLGGGIAGLLTARVLAEGYAKVTVVERDRLASEAVQRRGIPQGHHVHGLLPRGLQVMEELLPGLTDDLIADGALAGDILGQVRWHLGGRMLRQRNTGLTALSASRPLLETAIRARVRALPTVVVLDGHEAIDLCATTDGGRITGACIANRSSGVTRVLPADLVVDATGRGSRTLQWRVALGYPRPAEDRVDIGLWYASRLFTAPADAFGGDDVVVVTARHVGQPRGSVMQRLEGGRVLVTLNGVLGQRPPLDPTGFVEYARTLAAPDTHRLVRAGQPVGEPAPLRCPSYVRRRYERLSDHPAGLLVIGDAACSFNPVYGQGMSVAAVGVALLREELARGGEPDPGRYFTALASILDAPWFLAVGADLAIVGEGAPALPASRLTGEYLARLQRAAVDDAELAAAFIRVTALVDPPSALLKPAVAGRVAAAGLAVVG